MTKLQGLKRKLVLGTSVALLVAGASVASAADAIQDNAPPPPLPPSQTNLLWDGAYIGVYGGYDWLNAGLSPGSDIDGIDGLTGGVYLGYNMTLAPFWIGGLEASAGLGGAENNFGGHTVEKNWDASLRARLGYAYENSLIYGAAGLAGLSAEVSDATGSDSSLHLGWTIGAGIETMLTDEITARAEYSYSDYGTHEHNVGAGSRDVDLHGHAVKLGVGLKF